MARFGEYTNEETARLKSQAERVISKFGGPKQLGRVLVEMGAYMDPKTVYKWLQPRSKGGADGIIPSHAWPKIYAAARREGVLLTATDHDPRWLPG